MTLRLRINGEDIEVEAEPETPLVYVLRDDLKLKGTKLGCGLGQCGACAVRVDGDVVMSCDVEAGRLQGRAIETIEAVEATEAGRRIQDAFVTNTAAQCGYCTPGLVIAMLAHLERTTEPTIETAKDALALHLCRCGSHPRVLAAIESLLP